MTRPLDVASPAADLTGRRGAAAWHAEAKRLQDEGRCREGKEACLAMLRAWEGDRGAEFFEALITTVIAHGRLGELGAAQGFLEEATRLAVTDEQRYHCLKLTGNCQHGMDDYERALATYQEAWQLAVRMGAGERQAAILNNIGVVQRELGDVMAARDSYQRALALYADDRMGCRIARFNLAGILVSLGEYEAAEAEFHWILADAQHAEDLVHEALAGASLAALAWRRDQPDFSRTDFARALALLHEAGETRLHQRLLMERAELLAETGDHGEEALTLSQRALVEAEQVGEKRVLAALKTHVDLLSRAGRLAEALTAARRQAALEGEQHRRDSRGRLEALQVLHEMERLKHEAEVARLRHAELARVLAEADRQRERAERAHAFTQGVLEMAAHDLRNPVGALEGILELLQNEGDPKERAELTQLAREQTQVTLELLERLLDSVLVQRGELRLRLEALSLAGLVTAVGRAYATTAAAKQQRLVLTLDESVRVQGDPVRLRQVIENLWTNAIKYSPRRATVTVVVEAVADEGIVRVMDEGPGVPVADRERVFEPFVRLSGIKPTGGEASVGLGLHLARELTAAHGGILTIETGPAGKGSVHGCPVMSS